jgi:hypothetical protein
MRVKLTRSLPVDGLLFGEGSELTLGPDYAMALIERGDAVPAKPEAERTAVDVPETATPRKRKATKKAEE